jgi:hypothetical protein
MSTINERIKMIVNQMFKNASEFERVSGIKPSTVKNIIGGRLTKPSYDVLEAIIRNNVLLSAEWLLRGEGEMLKQSNLSLDENPSQKDTEQNAEYWKHIALTNMEIMTQHVDSLNAKIKGLEAEILNLKSTKLA